MGDFEWTIEREIALFQALKDNPPFALGTCCARTSMGEFRRRSELALLALASFACLFFFFLLPSSPSQDGAHTCPDGHCLTISHLERTANLLALSSKLSAEFGTDVSVDIIAHKLEQLSRPMSLIFFSLVCCIQACGCGFFVFRRNRLDAWFCVSEGCKLPHCLLS